MDIRGACTAASFPTSPGGMQESRSVIGYRQLQAATCILRSDLMLRHVVALVHNGSLLVLW